MPSTSPFAPEARDSAPQPGAGGEPLQIAVVNDHPVVVNGVARLVERYTDRVRVVEGDSDVPTLTPVDLALFDTYAAAADGRDGLADLLANPRVRHVAVFSWNHDPAAVAEALRRGASGYLSKSLDAAELVDAIVRISAGERVVEPGPAGAEPTMREWPGKERGLTSRESEMLALVAQGLTNQEIAETCYLSINSVKSYLRSAYRRIGVSRRSQAVLWATEHGLIPTPSRWLKR